jgi:hypothetical protein
MDKPTPIRKTALQRAQSMLIRASIAFNTAERNRERRAAEKIVPIKGQGGMTMFVTVGKNLP